MKEPVASMTLDEFAALVQKMRNSQREYFRTKSGTALEESKRLEREVDKALQKLKDKQREMFG